MIVNFKGTHELNGSRVANLNNVNAVGGTELNRIEADRKDICGRNDRGK